jgi:hypothetical protein
MRPLPREDPETRIKSAPVKVREFVANGDFPAILKPQIWIVDLLPY